MIKKTLEKAGLNKNEIEIYLEVMRLSKATPAYIAKITGIPRPTVYSSAKELIRKGYISKDFKGKFMSLVALPADELVHIVDRKKEELEREAQNMKKVAAELSKIQNGDLIGIPKIRYVEEAELEDFLYSRIGLWNSAARSADKKYWGFQDSSFVLECSKWIEDWFKHETSKGVSVNFLSDDPKNDSVAVSKTDQKRRRIRSLKKNLKFSSTLWVVGDYIIIINTQKKPFYLIEIQNELLAENMIEMFKMLWK